MLADQVKGNAARLDVIDSTGTRGVAVLSTQVADVIHDVAELRVEFAQHEQQHRVAEQARIAGRRWAFGYAVALATGLAAVIGLLVNIVYTVHR
jgi:hypothetical protein